MAYQDGSEAVAGRLEGAGWAGPVAAPSIVPVLPREPAARRSTRASKLPRCPEIDCIRDLLPPSIVSLAELQSAESGVGADQVLIASGIVDEEIYVTALAASLGMQFEPLGGMPRYRCLLPDYRLPEAAVKGILPLTADDGIAFVVAPRLVDSRRLVTLAKSGSKLTERISLTSAARLQNFVSRHATRAIESQAVNDLRDRRPELSAGAGHRRLVAIALCIGAAAIAATAMVHATSEAVELTIGFIFLAWTALRLLGLLSEPFIRRRPKAFSDDRLPVYTVLVALYREAAAVPGLVQALRQLDYPAEKLDIKLVLEPDDEETRKAAEALRHGARFENRPFEIVISPPGEPRTKPKALNAALPFVRGTFVAVFDAEDRPEPDQLRLALEAFVAADERLACVQARLTIDNAADSWLTRLFTAEYAGLFDVFLPGLAAWHLPLPLGGSSNHFRTSVLRQVGAWDPFNVTEDADLGMRFARFGYRTAMICSTTYEEAPVRLGLWLRQRTRWFKGWMQTWLVHMRTPHRLARELRLPGFAVFQLVVGGTVLAALVHAVFVAQLIWTLTTSPLNDTTIHVLLGFDCAVLLLGYLASAVLALMGLARRRLLGCAWALLLIPVYWALLSLAAWRALFQLMRDPYRWEKTEHGLARTSRLATRNHR